jgi:pSer/pThr/pTyr-binding forkhead associated (FHA) protein
MRLALEVTEGPLAGLKAEISEGQIVIIGRAERSDFHIAHDRYLSGRHAFVECARAGCRLRDLNSTNGTWLNGSRIIDAELLDGDMVLAGRTMIRVSIEGGTDSQPTGPKPVALRTVTEADENPPERPDPDELKNSILDRFNKEELQQLEDDESTEQLPTNSVLPNPFSPRRSPSRGIGPNRVYPS